MRALILAAGMGERLRPVTDTEPKPMVKIGGRPLIHFPLLMLRRSGIREIAINTHHLAHRVHGELGSGKALDLEITWAPEPVLLGTGGPLNGLANFLGVGTFLIANGDTILDLDVAEMVAFHRSSSALATLCVAQPANLDYYSHLDLDADSRLVRMRLLKKRSPVLYDEYSKNVDPAAALRSFMYCGVIVAEPQVLDLIPPKPPWSLMEGLFAPMIRDGLPVMGFVHSGYMRTIDDLAALEAVRKEFATNPPNLRFLDLTTR